MKVIHFLLGKANPDRMNGVNKVVHSLATQQVLHGGDVEVWGITPTPANEVNGRVYKTRFFQSHFFKSRVDTILKKAIEDLPKDTIFHLHGGFIPEFYSLSKKLSKEGLRYIITPHGNYMEGARVKNKMVKDIYFSLFEKSILERAFFVHCIGYGEIEDIRKIYKSNNLKLIPNGQDFDSFQFNEMRIPKMELPVFGFCGRLAMHQKGLDLLLEGFKRYKRILNGRGVLWLIGDGDYKESIIEFSKMNQLQDSLVVFGSKFGDEKLNLMNNMDVFYHPSRNEGLPMAVLEASVLGKPLVVSKYTNMTKYVSEYGAGICLVENTPDEIASSMQKVFEMSCTDELSTMGKNARRMAEENFDWKIISKMMLNAYDSTTIVTYA